MTNQNNKVAIFCGSFGDEMSLSEYLQINGDEDGESCSTFMIDFGIDHYDEDLAEMSFCADCDLVRALHEHSYAEGFDRQAFVDVANQEGNSLFLIYDFQVYFNVDELNIDPEAAMRMVGVYDYQKTH